MGTEPNIRTAIQNVVKAFRENPHIFLTEADVQCYLYSELYNSDQRLRKPHKARLIRRGKYLKFSSELERASKYHGRNRNTIRLHAEINKKGKYADLVVFGKHSYGLKPRLPNLAKNANPLPREFLSVYDYDFKPDDAIGIEIKFNRGHYHSEQTNQKRRNLKRRIKQDICKLKAYKLGYFIFVDKEKVFSNNKQFREEILGKNHDFDMIRIYYVTPKNNPSGLRPVTSAN